MNIAVFSPDDVIARLAGLGALMHACVNDGASIGYVLPFSAGDGEAFWRDQVLPGVRAGGRLLLVAQHDGTVAGSVQLDVDTPPNQPHRAEVRKLLVHPAFRRRGIGRLLMAELERHALARGRTLLTLDTRSGDQAEPLYAGLGYQVAGMIPGYCRDTAEASRFDATTIMYKQLAPSDTPAP
jgi:ribosomal protein S18 acetylase RimI-like enzyme